MSVIEQSTDTVRPEKPTVNYLNHDKSIMSWIYTVDHKRIGIMYLATISIVFLVAGVLALLVRTELIAPGETIVNADTYNQLFSLHGIMMVFLFIIPSVPAVMGNFAMPIQLGAKDVAFPRLNLASYYIFVLGGILAVAGMLVSQLDTGWTFYTPYSANLGASVIFITMAVFVAGFSSILTGLNFIVTIHKMRAPGLTWNRLPLFVWSIYATSIVQVLATPVIGITMVLLLFEKILNIGIFDPALGGDPVLFQHFFWFYSHPAVYIMILPAFGLVSDMVATFSRHEVQGYKFVALSSVAIAFLGFLVWGHHMFVSGQSVVSSIIFSLLTYLIGIPTGVKVINWVGTMYKGSISFKTPMLYTLSFLILFTIGGLTGIMLGVLSMDVHLHDTYFVVAHFHYVMMGGTVVAALGGLHYWWPKMTGKMYNETNGAIAAILVFIGFNVTFFTQFIMGSKGMPRRYYDYLPEFEIYHVISTIGSYVLGLGLFMAAGGLLVSLWKGKQAGPNPWKALTLEWTHTTSPPDPHNFHHTPIVTRGAYDYHKAPEIFGESGGDGAATIHPPESASGSTAVSD